MVKSILLQNIGYINCFTYEFWEGFKEIKDFNQQPKPIIITELLEFMDESISIDSIMKRVEKQTDKYFYRKK